MFVLEPKNHSVQINLLYEFRHKKNDVKEKLMSILCEKCRKQNEQHVIFLAHRYFHSFKKRWLAAKRTKTRFMAQNKAWLEKSLDIPCVELTCNITVGRPKGQFEDLSYAGKYKRIETLRSHETSELLFAAKMGLRASGNSSAAKLLSTTSESSSQQIKAATNLLCNKPTDSHSSQLSSDKALALMVDTNLSKRQYQLLRNNAIENKVNLYPSYNSVRESKKLCYPSEIIANEYSATVKLQSLLDHTVTRLFSALALPLDNYSFKSNLTLISKWGCDGSSGQKEYKQSFDGDYTDSNLLLSCLVPLELYTENSKNEKIILWQNPRPSSTVYCRPIKMQFLKETIQTSKIEKENMDKDIQELVDTTIEIQRNVFLFVKHKLVMSMVDNKMINSITNTSSQKCYICGASPIQMNSIDDLLEREIREEYLDFGISTLHAWIRSLECILKISYRLPLKKWQARGDEKDVTKQQKEKIQKEFKTRLGLIIDQTKQGTGTSNDGNTARKFFQNFVISSEITGIDQNLIFRFFVILQVLASGFCINISKFKIYTLETAKLFVSLYPWYRMPVSIHKILIHSSEIIKACPVPIGQLSEEAQEARNKEYRRYREFHSRKMSRTQTNIDVFHNLLISSDPVITNLRKIKSHKKKQLVPEAMSLLESFKPNPSFSNSSDSEED